MSFTAGQWIYRLYIRILPLSIPGNFISNKKKNDFFYGFYGFLWKCSILWRFRFVASRSMWFTRATKRIKWQKMERKMCNYVSFISFLSYFHRSIDRLNIVRSIPLAIEPTAVSRLIEQCTMHVARCTLHVPWNLKLMKMTSEWSFHFILWFDIFNYNIVV